MNNKLLLGLVIIGGIALGGCQTKTASVAQNPTPSPAATTTPVSQKPVASPTLSADEQEIKNIGTELDSADATKDFSDFSQTDLQ